MNVIAIAQHVDKAELRLWIENLDIKFPVLYDINGEVTSLFKIKLTPTKVLLDNRGRIRLIDPVRTEPEKWSEFLSTMKSIGSSD